MNFQRLLDEWFKPDRWHLTDKRFDALMFINCNKDFKHSPYLFK